MIEAGQQHGLVRVLERGETRHGGKDRLFLCLCTCGGRKWMLGDNLRRRPPKTHKFCTPLLDTLGVRAYEKAS